MRHSKPVGTPYTAGSCEPVDEWSREIFAALSEWANTNGGHWTRWDPGYLLLEINMMDGDAIDPILMDTADEELTVEFGYWEIHLPDQADDAQGAAGEAVELASQWLNGEIRTAVFTDSDGKWCGSSTIQRGDPMPPKPFDGIKGLNPKQVEVRTARKSEWQTFAV